MKITRTINDDWLGPKAQQHVDSDSLYSSALGNLPLHKVEDLESKYKETLKKQGVGGWEKSKNLFLRREEQE